MRDTAIEYVFTATTENGQQDVMVIEGDVAAIKLAVDKLSNKIGLQSWGLRRSHENQLRLVFRGKIDNHMEIFQQIRTATKAIIAQKRKSKP